MPLGSNARLRVVGSGQEVAWRVIPVCLRGQRGKKGFALPSGSRKRQCRVWRDDEIRASLFLRNAPVRVPA